MQTAKILNLDFLFLFKDVLKSCAAQIEEKTNEDQQRSGISPKENGLMGYDAGQSAGKTEWKTIAKVLRGDWRQVPVASWTVQRQKAICLL